MEEFPVTALSDPRGELEGIPSLGLVWSRRRYQASLDTYLVVIGIDIEDI